MNSKYDEETHAYFQFHSPCKLFQVTVRKMQYSLQK